MAKREHFTNGRVTALTLGATLMCVAFGAQIGSWQHWISIGIAYGSGLVFMGFSIAWISKSYYSREDGSSGRIPSGGNFAGRDNRSFQLGSHGQTVIGDSAIAQIFPAPTPVPPVPSVPAVRNLEYPTLELRREWKRAIYRFNPGGWELAEHEQESKNVLLLWVKNPRAGKGTSGIIVQNVTAHIEVRHAQGCTPIPRAYWLRSTVNTTFIESGSEKAVIVGYIDHGGIFCVPENHFSEDMISPYDLPVREMGSKHTIVRDKTAISITVSIVDSISDKTIEVALLTIDSNGATNLDKQ